MRKPSWQLLQLAVTMPNALPKLAASVGFRATAAAVIVGGEGGERVAVRGGRTQGNLPQRVELFAIELSIHVGSPCDRHVVTRDALSPGEKVLRYPITTAQGDRRDPPARSLSR